MGGTGKARPMVTTGRCKWVSDLGRKCSCFRKVKEASYRGRNGRIEMGSEADRPTGDSQQQKRAEQEGRSAEQIAVGDERVQQCWSWHRGLGSLL